MKPFILLGRLLFKTTLPVYNSYLVYKRIFIKFYSPFQKKHFLIHPFARRYVIHILIIIISLIVTTSNLNALEIKKDDTGYTNILASLVQSDDYETIYEEGPIDGASSSHYLNKNVVEKDLYIDYDDYIEEGDLDVITNSGALVKPILSPSEIEAINRNEIVQYAVQDGDTISSIANLFGISINTILWENNLTSYSIIRPGQTLSILPVAGIRHKVLKGENISKIAKKYSIDEEEIIDFNRLASADDLQLGEVLIIPGGRKPQATQTFVLRKIAPPQISDVASIVAPDLGKMFWPAGCKRISQYYNWKHHGVDIACSKGSSIVSAGEGTVIKAQGGWNGGYGIMVVVDHGNGKQTLYGHLSQLYVSVGDAVAAGQALGAEGSTGRSTGPHVHFEVRQDGARVNPLSIIK